MKNRKKLRTCTGSAISEFGPALFLLLVIIFFPMLDLMAIGFQYGLGYYCNSTVCREMSVRTAADISPGSPSSTVATQVFNNINSTGITSFLGITSQNQLSSTATFIPATAPTPGQPPQMVLCTTTMTVSPFISVPWFQPIPGLNAPMTFTFASSRQREVTQ